MLDLEQRAHDLALLYLQLEIKENIIKYDASNTFKDFVDEYKKLYDNIYEDLAP